MNYSCEVDVWATGCVLGEMLTGEPLFSGNNNKEQFLKILHTLGPIPPEDLKVMGYAHHLNTPEFKVLGLEARLPSSSDPLMVDLLKKMLDYNPRRRIDPFQALTHPFFDELRSQKLLINNRQLPDFFDFR